MSAPLTLLRLIERSPDRGDEWRSVSDLLWPFITEQAEKYPDLIELSTTGQSVRLTNEGRAVMKHVSDLWRS